MYLFRVCFGQEIHDRFKTVSKLLYTGRCNEHLSNTT